MNKWWMKLIPRFILVWWASRVLAKGLMGYLKTPDVKWWSLK